MHATALWTLRLEQTSIRPAHRGARPAAHRFAVVTARLSVDAGVVPGGVMGVSSHTDARCGVGFAESANAPCRAPTVRKPTCRTICVFLRMDWAVGTVGANAYIPRKVVDIASRCLPECIAEVFRRRPCATVPRAPANL